MIRTVSKWVLALSLALVAVTPSLAAAADQGCTEADRIMAEQEKAKKAFQANKDAVQANKDAQTLHDQQLEVKRKAKEARNTAQTNHNTSTTNKQKAEKAVTDQEAKIKGIEGEITALEARSKATEPNPSPGLFGSATQPTADAKQALIELNTKKTELKVAQTELERLKGELETAKTKFTETETALGKATEADEAADTGLKGTQTKLDKSKTDMDTAAKDEKKTSTDLFELVRSKTGRAAMRCTKVHLTPAGAAWAYSVSKTGQKALQNARGTGEFDLFSREKPAGTAAEQAKKAAELGGYGVSPDTQSNFEKNIQARIQENMDLRAKAEAASKKKGEEIAAIPNVEPIEKKVVPPAAGDGTDAEKAKAAAAREARLKPFKQDVANFEAKVAALQARYDQIFVSKVAKDATVAERIQVTRDLESAKRYLETYRQVLAQEEAKP